MLGSVNSTHTAVDDLESYGVDPEIVPSVQDEDYQVTVEPPSVRVSEEQLEILPDPLEDDGSQGVNIYLQCLSIIEQQLIRLS